MSDNDYTWRAAEADAHTAASEAFAYAVAEGENVDDGAEYDAAHEFADGSEWVIYYHRAACLWFDSHEVQDAEDNLDELHAPYGVDSSLDIRGRMALCVYHALIDAFVEEWQNLAAAHAEALDAAEVEA